MIKLDVPRINKNLKDMALAIRKQILDNTKKGVDVEGNDFDAYSEAYLKAKADYMSKGKGTPINGNPSTVNLMLTGVMLRSMAVTRLNTSTYVIYFSDKNRALVAYAHQTGKGRLPVRKFFGVSDANADRIFKRYFSQSLLLKKG